MEVLQIEIENGAFGIKTSTSNFKNSRSIYSMENCV